MPQSVISLRATPNLSGCQSARWGLLLGCEPFIDNVEQGDAAQRH
jgi:hypothetical protein